MLVQLGLCGLTWGVQVGMRMWVSRCGAWPVSQSQHERCELAGGCVGQPGFVRMHVPCTVALHGRSTLPPTPRTTEHTSPCREPAPTAPLPVTSGEQAPLTLPQNIASHNPAPRPCKAAAPARLSWRPFLGMPYPNTNNLSPRVSPSRALSPNAQGPAQQAATSNPPCGRAGCPARRNPTAGQRCAEAVQ